MKKLIFIALFSISSLCSATAYDTQIQWRSQTNSLQTLILPAPPNHGVLIFNFDTKKPEWRVVGSGLEIETLYINAPFADWNDSTGHGQILNKPSWPSNATNLGRSLITAPDPQQARYIIGAGVSNFSPFFSNLNDIPAWMLNATSTGESLITAPDIDAVKDMLGTTGAPQPHVHDAADIASGVLSASRIPSLSIGKIDDLQLTLDGKALSSHVHVAADLSNSTAVGRGVLTAADQVAARTVLGAIGSADLSSYVTSSSLASTLGGYATSATLTSGLSGKFNSPAGTDAQHIRGDGSIAFFPVQRVRAQTNTSGVYTWTFSNAYGSGVVPVVGITVEDSTSATWNHQITAISNTSVTIQLTKTTAVTVLGVSVLGVGSSPQAYVHLTAISP